MIWADRRRFLAGAASLAGLSACGSGGNAGPLVVANASGTINLTLAEMLRRERLYEAMGVKVQELDITDGTRIMGGIVGGTIHGCMISGIGQIFPAVAKGAKVRIIGGGIMRPLLALFSAKPGINSLKALEGKTVGAGSVGALTWQLTAALLRDAGVDLAKVRFVNVGSSADVYRAVAAGTIDAGAAAAALADAPLPTGLHMVPGSNMAEALPRFCYAAAWASQAAMEARRDQLIRALAAHARLYRLLQSPEGKGPFIAARKATLPHASEAEHEAQWDYFQRWKPFATALEITPAQTDYLQATGESFGIKHRRLAFADVADMSLAQEALKLAGER